MADSSSLTDYLAELGVDVNNLQEFLLKLSQILSTKSDSVKLTQTLQDGTTTEFLVPSFGYLSGRVNNIENKFNDLLSGNANQLGVRDADGNLRTFELKDISAVITDLENVSKTGVSVPAAFNYKTNWFFESFLNPLLYVNIDTATLATDPDINRFEATRLIITSKITSDINYFDATYKGKNNLVYADVIKDLGNRGISYFEDTAELELPPAKNTVRGTFDVTNITKSEQSEVIGGQTLTTTILKYTLNTLQYSGITATSTVEKTLKVGDSLITADNTEYQVSSVDASTRTVILKLIFGTTGIAIGPSQLRIKPVLERSTLVQLNLGYDERNIIFLKPISDRLAVTTDQHSQGFAIYTNELTITMNDGKNLNLTDFYKNFVSDFGLLFLNYAKEKKIPSTLGEVPNIPILSSDNFKVVQIDQHIQDADNTVGIKQKIAAKEQAAAQVRELDKQITDTRANLNTNASLNEAQKLKLEKDLKSFADTRLTLTKSQQSLISDITTSIKSTPSFITSPEYRVRGFWSIPDVKQTAYGNQNVVQFKIAYRTLSKTGNAKAADQIEFADTDGTMVAAAFSPWTEFLSKPRTKKYNSLTGFYEWSSENVADPDQVNSNQLDVPIKKGEIIEVRVKSLSEAGWPDSPVESDWSESILVEFPADIETMEDATIVSQQAFAEEARLSFQDELNSKGLDIHLSTAFTTRDKYYAHKSEDIASGFFASDGNIIDLYTKLKSIADTLSAVQTAVSTGKGAIKISIIDQLGNERAVTNGESIELFAGYYKDLIKDTSVTPVQYSHGKVVATQYYIQIQNTSATALQLIATLNGGVGVQADTSDPVLNPSSNYHKNLRYDRSSLVINNAADQPISSFTQREGYQSSQVQSQYILARYKDIKLANDLYAGDGLGTYPYVNAPSTNYNYGGFTVGSSTVPYVYGHYVPFNPLLTSLPYTTTSNASVWNGTVNGSNIPQGNGRLSEFCIHTGHPSINPGGDYNFAWNNTTYATARPSYSSGNTSQKYLPFSHGIHFETAVSEGTNVFGVKYYQQAAYQKPATVPTPFPTSANMRENQYPIKCGFDKNDEWLIGKYTCGSYLFLAPSSYSAVSVDGISPAGSYKYLDFGTESAIKIPLIFQFRASDKLGYIGGWRLSNPAGLKNIKYAKKVGLDIYYLGSVFSFDVTVSTQYEKETAVVTPLSAVQSTASTVITATA
jgi:hypothetical protein